MGAIMKKRSLHTIALFVTLAISASALAQFQKPDDAIRYRRAVFEVMSFHFGAINQALTTGPFAAHDVEANALLVDSLAKLPWHAFLPGTQASSRAKPEIWTQKDRFKKAVDEFQGNTAALLQAAHGGDKAAVKTAFDNTAKSCKGCHDQFRVN
jgi:cytochrome c556